MVILEFATESSQQALDVTRAVEEALVLMRLRFGAVLVFCPHTTAGVTLNENTDPYVMEDLHAVLARLVPFSHTYRHAEGNAHAHTKASLVGAQLLIPVEKSRLKLGPWQGIFLLEFDGPRQRKLYLQPLVSPSPVIP